MVKELLLAGGAVALVDDEDFVWASAYSWHLAGGHGAGQYVARGGQVDGRKTTCYLHREIVRPAGGLTVDHVNGDKLDNRRANLRTATDVQNKQNQAVARGRTGVRGVVWHRQKERYRALAWIDHRRIHLGYFRTIEEAAAAVAEGRRRLYTHAPECLP